MAGLAAGVWHWSGDGHATRTGGPCNSAAAQMRAREAAGGRGDDPGLKSRACFELQSQTSAILENLMPDLRCVVPILRLVAGLPVEHGLDLLLGYPRDIQL